MNRTTTSGQKLQTLSELVSRALLASRLGYQYGGDRDIYQALGYPTTILYEDYASRYARQDIAGAIIDRPVDATWRGPVTLLESDDDKDTPLEKGWKELCKELALKTVFNQVDKLTGIGRFGIVLLGLNDIGRKEHWAVPATPGKKLLYVRAFGEGDVTVKTWVKTQSDPRYGLPLTYTIEVSNPDGGSETLVVHHTRVVHIVDNPLNSLVYGTPRLEAVWNRLVDLEKLTGGSAEMFWRGARPGYHGNIDKEFELTSAVEKDLQDQMDEFEHDLRRFLTTQGVDIKTLGAQVSDPKSHVDIQIQMISARTGIPKRILTGSERGELASSQDREEWLSYIQKRREDFADPCIVRKFVDRCIELRILPPTREDGYTVEWEDLFAQSDREKTEIGKNRASALRDYATNPGAQEIVPPESFLRIALGLNQEEVNLIMEERDTYLVEEQKEMQSIEEELEQET